MESRITCLEFRNEVHAAIISFSAALLLCFQVVDGRLFMFAPEPSGVALGGCGACSLRLPFTGLYRTPEWAEIYDGAVVVNQ